MSEITYNLLVVDDDERIRNLLSQYLIKEDFIVSTASGAEEARKKTQLIKFDLIILDIICLLYTSPSPRDRTRSRMPSSA